MFIVNIGKKRRIVEMAQANGIDTIVGRLEAWIRSPEGKLDLAKSGVKVALVQTMRSPWEKILNLQKAVAHLKEEAKNFKDITGIDVSPEITVLIAEAERDIQCHRKRSLQGTNILTKTVYTI